MTARFHIAHPIPSADGTHLCRFTRHDPPAGGTASGATPDQARASAMQAIRDTLAAEERSAELAAARADVRQGRMFG